jgi:hypothetical protein
MLAVRITSHFYDFMKRRVLDPETPAGPWTPGLLPRALTSPEAEATAAAFAAAAPTRAPEPRKRVASYLEAKREPGDADADGDEADAKRARGEGLFEESIGGNRIGDRDPAGDFAREIAANDSGILGTLKVMGALRTLLREMVSYLGPARHPAVLEGLAALRRECIAAKTASTYTGALEDMFVLSAGQADGGIWCAHAGPLAHALLPRLLTSRPQQARDPAGRAAGPHHQGGGAGRPGRHQRGGGGQIHGASSSLWSRVRSRNAC